MNHRIVEKVHIHLHSFYACKLEPAAIVVTIEEGEDKFRVDAKALEITPADVG